MQRNAGDATNATCSKKATQRFHPNFCVAWLSLEPRPLRTSLRQLSEKK